MIEESPEAFIQRWRRHAAGAQLFSRTEGSPLLECRLGDALVQLFERTGPYVARPGPARVVVNPSTTAFEPAEPGQRAIEATGLGMIRASGLVVERDGRSVVLDCGVPLVVSLLEPEGELPEDGRFVRFESVGPIHGFVVPSDSARGGRRHEESPDDAM